MTNFLTRKWKIFVFLMLFNNFKCRAQLKFELVLRK